MTANRCAFGTQAYRIHISKLLMDNKLLDLNGFSSYNLIDTKITKRQTDGYEDKATSRC